MAKASPVKVQQFLKGIDYPISKDDLVAEIEAQGADEEIVDMVRKIPLDRFDSPRDVSEGLEDMV